MSWLVTNTLVAGVLALLVMGVGRWLRPAPAAMHVLWLFVLLKLVLPPLFEVPVDVSWLRAETVVEPVVVPLSVEPTGAAVDAARPALELPAIAPAPQFALDEMLLCAWGAGSALFVGFLLLGVVRGRRRLRSLGPVPLSLRREVETLAARLGVGVPELLDDPAATSPFVWSIGQVRLVLPVRVLAAATPKGRAAVLVHELAHLRRGDHWLAQLELLLASVLWWHPLFWFARARLRLWAELACDAWAIASVPEATIDFATVLIEAVARPDSAVPGMTVLAARPAARAAFERRLTMILNENVPCRGSRAWWLPFTVLGLGLFAVPVAAQEEETPVRVEVRVNGKKVDQLSGEARRILLERLQREEEEAAEARPGKKKKSVDEAQDPVGKKGAAKTAKPGKNKKAVVPDNVDLEDLDFEGLPDQIRAGLKAGFAEARKEIRDNKDLRELGITDEVLDMVDNIGSGKGLEKNIDSVIKAAMKGAGSVIVKELQADGTLRDLGVKDISEFVNDLVEKGYDAKKLGDIAVKTAKSALKDAKVEVLHDVDLKKLGIEEDVSDLIDDVISGKGNFNGSLQKIIDKAIKSALREAKEENEEEEEAEEVKPAPKKKLERKNKGRDEVLIR